MWDHLNLRWVDLSHLEGSPPARFAHTMFALQGVMAGKENVVNSIKFLRHYAPSPYSAFRQKPSSISGAMALFPTFLEAQTGKTGSLR
jgi:hypothetical protein